MWNSTTASLKYNVKVLLKFYLYGKHKDAHLCNKPNIILGCTFAYLPVFYLCLHTSLRD